MPEQLVSWLIKNWIEITGSCLGILYVFFSVKQNILTWLTGLLTSLLYIAVFFNTKFYADMALQFYYVAISIYGWYYWLRGKKVNDHKEELPVTFSPRKYYLFIILISSGLWIGIYFILKKFTDSPVPVGDSFTTALSIVATWMLARKLIEHWLIWILVDLVSLGLYIYKGLYPTSLMFFIYTGAAIWGYLEWKKDLYKQDAPAV
ncbi:MAG: nicotinamide mononucleotide transporter [Prolixibacteraceae bacterium]|nr:nicotinamide mononucleotide transporter [Prolixibacteraceae bacterium]